MPETYCVRHFDQLATGYCSVCNKPYCADGLEVEAGQPICANCKQVKAAQAMEAAGIPMAGLPLNFKNKGLDDDPLGLLGAPSKPTAPKMEPSSPVPPPLAPVSAPAPQAAPPNPFPAGPLAPPKPVPPPPSPVAGPALLNL